MDSAVMIRSFQCAVGTTSCLRNVLEQPPMLAMTNAARSNLACGGKGILSTRRQGSILVSCAKASDATLLDNSNESITSHSGDAKGAISLDNKQSLTEKKSLSASFPSGFEALLTEVCDETKIAEIKVKFGAFEMHMKRNIDGPTAPAPTVLQTTVPSVQSAPSPPSTPPKSSNKVMPVVNVAPETGAKLAKLDASGSSGYVLVASPAVGLFRRSRTLKGKKQPPACKEGDVIKEGQIIGYLDRFGGELPVRSEVAGEVLKLLYEDGEAVGYGDPLVAVLPSFPGIN